MTLRPALAVLTLVLAVSLSFSAAAVDSWPVFHGPDGSVASSELWRDEPGRLARSVLADLEREAGFGGTYTSAQYAELLAGLLSAEMARKGEGHPLVAIWGTLEARVQGADSVLLGGLNEGVWPEMPPPDPWLSRQMRLKAGLLLPERRTGLSARSATGACVRSRRHRNAASRRPPPGPASKPVRR